MVDRRSDGGDVRPQHAAAAEAFVSRARAQFEDAVETMVVFGSAARDEAAGLSSDVDVLVVLAGDADRSALEESLGDLAYGVMLEFGPVVELHVLSSRRFETLRDRGNPFVRNAVSEGRTYA